MTNKATIHNCGPCDPDPKDDIINDLVRQLSDAVIDLEALAKLATSGMNGEWTLGMFRRLSAHKETLAKAKAGA